ncbi:hypothetical protein [Cyclobacterium xiamenense]|uniref:hypothetical protein n=1 Tax=Cyclobacterium xiamenense TaxID=1297121 RepID=UPI0012B95B39|nr:hypothetical protein [Cyclobacterium xiamenense]
MNHSIIPSLAGTKTKETPPWARYYRKYETSHWFRQDPTEQVLSVSHTVFADELQIEFSDDKQGQGACFLSSRRQHGIYRVFTELKPTYFQGWHYGGMPIFQKGKPLKRLILVRFCSDGHCFRLYVLDSESPTGPDLQARITRKILEILRSIDTGPT